MVESHGWIGGLCDVRFAKELCFPLLDYFIELRGSTARVVDQPGLSRCVVFVQD